MLTQDVGTTDMHYQKVNDFSFLDIFLHFGCVWAPNKLRPFILHNHIMHHTSERVKILSYVVDL